MIAVIFNPTARGEKATAFRQQLGALEGPLRLLPTRGPGDASALAADAAEKGFETVVAAGGDGTVNEVVNGLAQSGVFPIGPRLGVLPLGTINVFAKEVGIPAGFEQAWKIIVGRHTQAIDLPWAMHSGTRRWFVQMAGAGLDSHAIALVNWELKKRIGPLAYLWAGLRALGGPLPEIQVRGGPAAVHAQLALIGNGRFYGGRIQVFRQAKLSDGLLDLAALPRTNVVSLARVAAAMAGGRLLEHPGIIHQQAPAFSFSCGTEASFQVEGDNAGRLPVTFGIQPRALNILIPAAATVDTAGGERG